jgi:hypothetical protein
LDTATPLPSVTWFSAEGSALSTTLVTGSFETQQLVFTVQSQNNASGEIRGAITPSPVSYLTDAGETSVSSPANGQLTFAALFGGDQVRPRNVITAANAYGSVTIDPVSKRITGFIVSSGIIGLTAQIHDALPGTAGGVVVALQGGPVVWTVPENTFLNDSQIARLISGAYYLSIGSTVFPGEELRGQLNQRVRIADLKGSNEVPPILSDASGTGFLAVNPLTLQFTGYVKLSGLTSPVRSVILHTGAAGVNGTSIIILANSGNGIWSVPPNTVLSAAQVTNFNNSELYFNVRTQNNPNGELRGQLQAAAIRIGTSILTPATGMPAAPVSATGTGILAWNSVTEKICGSVRTTQFDGVAATIQTGSGTAAPQNLLTLTTGSPVSVAATPGISYALDIQPLFTARCLGGSCHASGGLAPMSLETGVSYPFVRLLLVPGSSESSYIVQRLTVNSTSFPQMPLNRTPLSTHELDLIKNWIEKGALNN